MQRQKKYLYWPCNKVEGSALGGVRKKVLVDVYLTPVIQHFVCGAQLNRQEN